MIGPDEGRDLVGKHKLTPAFAGDRSGLRLI